VEKLHMLLKHRPPGIEAHPAQLRQGLEHVDQKAIVVIRWLNANKVDFVLVGPVAQAIRGDLEASGPVGIVPAPYGRNFERLCNALVAVHAGLRADGSSPGAPERPQAVAVKLTTDKLARGKRWMLHFDGYDLDIEGAGAAGAPGYQELLYEANRFELEAGVSVEVGGLEDLERYSHAPRAGAPPEFRVSRNPSPSASRRKER